MLLKRSVVAETCCGRLSCWQWGRPPKQVRKYFLKKTQIPCSRACCACLSRVARCAAEQGRHVRALRPGGGAGVGEPEEEDNVASVARGAPQAYYGRCGRAICHARGGLELVLIHRNPVCCCRRAWQTSAASGVIYLAVIYLAVIYIYIDIDISAIYNSLGLLR